MQYEKSQPAQIMPPFTSFRESVCHCFSISYTLDSAFMSLNVLYLLVAFAIILKTMVAMLRVLSVRMA